MTRLSWEHVLEVMAEACASGAEERRVILVLGDRAYQVVEVLGEASRPEGGLLGFVVYKDEPDLANRGEETCLVFLDPGQIQRVEVHGHGDKGGSLGF